MEIRRLILIWKIIFVLFEFSDFSWQEKAFYLDVNVAELPQHQWTSMNQIKIDNRLQSMLKHSMQTNKTPNNPKMEKCSFPKSLILQHIAAFDFNKKKNHFFNVFYTFVF